MGIAYVERRIRLRRYEFTVQGLLNIVVGIILLFTLFAPITALSLNISAPRTRINVIRGHLRLTINGFGGVLIDGILYYQYLVGETLTAKKVFEFSYYYIHPILALTGVLCFIGALLLILNGLLDGSVIRISKLMEKKDLLGLVGSFLSFGGLFIAFLIINSLSLGRPLNLYILIPERAINLSYSFLTIGEFKVILTDLYYSLSGFKQAGARFSLSLRQFSIGALLWALMSIIAIITNVDNVVFKKKMLLRKSWRLRINGALVVLLSMMFPLAGFVDLRIGNGVAGYFVGVFKIAFSSKIDIYLLMTIFSLAFVIFIICYTSQATLPGVLMRAEEFLSFDLPPEELARRSKLLPIYSRYVSVVKMLTGILYLIGISGLAGFLLKTLLPYYFSLVGPEVGFLWVEPMIPIALVAASIGFISYFAYLE